jgi:hypothetical protein
MWGFYLMRVVGEVEEEVEEGNEGDEEEGMKDLS